MKSKLFNSIHLQIGLIFIIPILLIHTGLFPMKWRFSGGILIGLLVIGIMINEKWSLRKIGLNFNKPFDGFGLYSLITILSIGLILALANIFNFETIQLDLQEHEHFNIFLLFLLSFIQELIYRSFLIEKLKCLTTNKSKIILWASLLFAFMHTIFPPLLFFTFGTFIAGLIWSWAYLKYPNLIFITLSHMAINATAIYFCFVKGFAACPL